MKKHFVSLLFCVLSCPYITVGQTINPPVLTPDEPVHAIVAKGDTVFVGGRFFHTGKFSGGMAEISTTSDVAQPAFPKMPFESVRLSIPDGSGGYYIALGWGLGSIHHVNSNSTYDSSFQLLPGGISLNDLALKNGVLYIGGEGFIHPGTQEITGLLALDLTTQQLLSTIPTVHGAIDHFAAKGSRLYVTGSFDSVAHQSRKGIAALETNTSNLLPWYPSLPSCYAEGSYSVMTFHGGRMFIATDIADTCTGGQSNYRILVLKEADGSFKKLLFDNCGNLGNCQDLNRLYSGAHVDKVAVDGDRLFLYTSGAYDTRLTAIDLTAGKDTVLWARYFEESDRTAGVIAKNNHVYLAGELKSIYQIGATNDYDSLIERRLFGGIKLSASSGTLEQWDPHSNDFIAGGIRTICESGNKIFLGGQFTHMNCSETPSFYAFSNATQQLLPLQMLTYAGDVTNKLQFEGGAIFLAGSYQSALGTNGYTLRAITLGNFEEIPLGLPYFGEATALAVTSTHYIIAGNVSDSSGGIQKSGLLAIERQTGLVESWAPNPNGNIRALFVSGGKLFVGGNFSLISGQNRDYFAVYDMQSWGLTNFSNPVFNGPINAISENDSALLVGGDFDLVGTTGANYRLVGLSKTTGALIKYANDGFSFGRAAVNDITPTGQKIVTANAQSLDSCGGPNIFQDDVNYDLRDYGCFSLNSGFGALAAVQVVGSDLYYGGGFIATENQYCGTNLGRISFPDGYFNGTTTISDLSKVSGPALSPNPTNGDVHVGWSKALRFTDITVTDVNGKQLLRFPIPPDASAYDLNLINLPAGLYLIRLQGANGAMAATLIKN